MGTIERPALGANVGLGTLYDARTDSFLLGPALEFGSGQTANVFPQEQRTMMLCDNRDRRLEVLDLPDSLTASCLAGFVEYEGSGIFLSSHNSEYTEEGDIYHAVHFTTAIARQELNVEMLDSRRNFAEVAPRPTHVVTQILFGGCCTVVVTGCIKDAKRRVEVLKRFANASKLAEGFDMRPLDLETLESIMDLVLDSQLSIHCYSDPPFRSSGRSATVPQIKQHLKTMFELRGLSGYEAAVPLGYTLTPLKDFTGLRSTSDSVNQLDSVDFRAIQYLASTFDRASVSLRKHLTRLERHRSFVRAEDLLDCHNAIADIKTAESSFNTGFSKLLTSVRGNVADYGLVKRFIEDFSRGAFSAARICSVMSYSGGKMDLIDELCAKGATCVPYHTRDAHIASARFVFYFSEMASRHPSWNQNLTLVMQLLGNKSVPLIAVDCDRGTSLAKAQVSQVNSSKLVVDDMIEQRAREAGLCFIQFDKGSIDVKIKDTQRNTSRSGYHVQVKIVVEHRTIGFAVSAAVRLNLVLLMHSSTAIVVEPPSTVQATIVSKVMARHLQSSHQRMSASYSNVFLRHPKPTY